MNILLSENVLCTYSFQHVYVSRLIYVLNAHIVICILAIHSEVFFDNSLCLLAQVLVHYYVVCLISCIDSVDEDKMLATGISRFCEDTGLDPTSSTVLILAWKFKAATQCEFTRAEFVGGMTELGCVLIYIIFKRTILSD